MTEDPVCRMKVGRSDPGSCSLSWQDVRYFFCSAGCMAEFLRHPEDYMVERGASAEEEGSKDVSIRVLQGE